MPETPAEPADEGRDHPDALPAAESAVGGGMWRWIERAAAAVLALAAGVTALHFYRQDRDSRELAAAQAAARAAACAYAPVMANYDAKTLDTYFREVLDGATGDWRKEFTDTSTDLRQVLTQGQVVSKSRDVRCALESGDAAHAQVVVVVAQSITSIGTKGKEEPGQLSVVFSMTKSGDRWLVDKVDTPLPLVP
ncbi:MAG: hypothetical protein HOQ24_12595 [Mycobacteriaceae bacterium]|nr:hypothetical protein [Mycobacteriaceae bacterium]